MLSVGMFLALSINLYVHRNLLTILSFFLLLLVVPVLIINNKKIANSSLLYAIFLFICFSSSIHRAKVLYGYSLSDIFFAARQYIWIFLFLVLIYLFKNSDSNLKRVLDNTVNILLISLGVRSISWAVYTVFKVELFPSILREYGNLWYRNEYSIRVDGTPLIVIGLLISVFFYFKFRNLKYLYNSLFIILYIIFVNQTRILLLSILISIFVMFIYSRRTTRFVTFISLIIAISSFIFGGGIDYIRSYFNIDTGLMDMGLGFRYWELKYYLGLLNNNIWKTGVGVLTSNNINSYYILAGPGAVKMYLDDLGFIELFVQFGIVAFLMYGYIFYKIISLIVRMSSEKFMLERAFFIALLVNLIITSISLNIFGAQRSFSLAIILAIIFYYDYKLKHNIEDQVCDG